MVDNCVFRTDLPLTIFLGLFYQRRVPYHRRVTGVLPILYPLPPLWVILLYTALIFNLHSHLMVYLEPRVKPWCQIVLLLSDKILYQIFLWRIGRWGFYGEEQVSNVVVNDEIRERREVSSSRKMADGRSAIAKTTCTRETGVKRSWAHSLLYITLCVLLLLLLLLLLVVLLAPLWRLLPPSTRRWSVGSSRRHLGLEHSGFLPETVRLPVRSHGSCWRDGEPARANCPPEKTLCNI
jgi:hypothetical protein